MRTYHSGPQNTSRLNNQSIGSIPYLYHESFNHTGVLENDAIQFKTGYTINTRNYKIFQRFFVSATVTKYRGEYWFVQGL